MSSETVSERMTADILIPAKARQVLIDKPIDGKGTDGFIRGEGAGEKPVSGLTVGKPVISKNIQSIGSKDGVTVRTILAVGNMNGHVPPTDILIFKMADFTNPETGGIQKRDDSFVF
jgi:hypothetical protein